MSAMQAPGLRLEQAPPISVPFRFFLTAPVFLLLAAAALLWRGSELAQSRFSPAAIAATHLYVLGFMSMVMIGALQQMLPVLAGAPIRWPRAVAALTHAGVTLGALGLAAGFLFGQPMLLTAGAVALGSGFSAFLLAVAASLLRAPVRSATVGAIWLAMLSLLATVAMGLSLASTLASGDSPPQPWILDLHPAWGLLGWTGLLVMGIGFHVMPMLQSTPAYPLRMARWFAGIALALLLAWSAATWFNPFAAVPTATRFALAIVYGAFAAVTIGLLRKRRRRLPDVTADFWSVGMVSLFAACAMWAFRAVAPAPMHNALDLSLGVLALVGFAGSVINGMLYKIVPFLAWFHAQAQAAAGSPTPNMRAMLGQAEQRLQFRCHLAALALLLFATTGSPVWMVPAALALGLSATLLERNLLVVALRRAAAPTQ